MSAASEQARKAITEVDAASRKSFEVTVAAAQTQLRADLQRLFGGERPERRSQQTTELLSKAARQFDPSDPTSPMAKHAAELSRQQDVLASTLATNHESLATNVEALTTAVSVQVAARQASVKIASVTPLKGMTCADGVHAIVRDIATGLGEEYRDTGTLVGYVTRSRKGAGVLTGGDVAARVVLEMTDSPRAHWNDYLDEAERNRAASASLGLVRDQAQNAGQVDPGAGIAAHRAGVRP